MRKYSATFLILTCLCLFFVVSNAQATGVVGQCGTLNGSSLGTLPTDKSEMCVRGAATVATVSGPNWVWSCNGSGTSANASCSAVNCGSGSCNTPSGGIDTNGTCGSAHGGIYADVSAVNAAQRCVTGTATGATLSGLTLSWSCNGIGSGTNDSCEATAPSLNGVCKVYSGGYASQPASDSSSGCHVGTYADESNTPDWAWSCASPSGGTTDNCTATNSPGGACSPTPNTCTVGTPAGYAVGACGGNATWGCLMSTPQWMPIGGSVPAGSCPGGPQPPPASWPNGVCILGQGYAHIATGLCVPWQCISFPSGEACSISNPPC